MNGDKKYLIALSHFSKFGPVRMRKIKKYFPLFKYAFSAGTKELVNAGIEENIANESHSHRIIDLSPAACGVKMTKK